jgi:hypothetical protein
MAQPSAVTESVLKVVGKYTKDPRVKKAAVESFDGPAMAAFEKLQASHIKNMLEASHKAPSEVVRKTLVEAVQTPCSTAEAQALGQFAKSMLEGKQVNGKALVESLDGISPLVLKAIQRTGKAMQEAALNVPTDEDITEATGLLTDYQSKTNEANDAKKAAVAKVAATVNPGDPNDPNAAVDALVNDDETQAQ